MTSPTTEELFKEMKSLKGNVALNGYLSRTTCHYVQLTSAALNMEIYHFQQFHGGCH